MKYTNNRIKQLIAERNTIIEKYNREIQNEIDKEKSNYKFSWKRFSLMILAVVFLIVAFEVNKKIFPKTSIWSWEYYMSESKIDTK